jgi:SAM-dependent methyltransferase
MQGFCWVDRKPVRFQMDDLYASRTDNTVEYNWRERMICPDCGLNNRLRGAVHLLHAILDPAPDARIWLTERRSPLHSALKARQEALVGSEFFGDDKASGWISPDGTRHEDVTASSFADQSLDVVLSFDVLEHVPEPTHAFTDIARILAPGGGLMFSVPFLFWAHESRIRARRLKDGSIEHLLPPEYHSDPVNSSAGILCFREFGWDVLDELKAAGFNDAYCVMYQSIDYGYAGGPQVMFVARKAR